MTEALRHPALTGGSPVGPRLAAARKQAGLSAEAVADQAAISRRTLTKIEASDPSVAFGSYLAVASVVGAHWLLEADRVTSSPVAAPLYITGISALCLPIDGFSALWYTQSLAAPSNWQVAGYNMTGAGDLLGVAHLREVGGYLRDLGVNVETVWAADFERATFDFLYHFLEIRKQPVPNLQATDIDGSVDFELIARWIDETAPFLSDETPEAMRRWLSKGMR